MKGKSGNGPRPEVDALLVALRDRVAAQGPGSRVAYRPAGGPPSASEGASFAAVRDALSLGTVVQHVGLRRPDFPAFGPIRRRLANLASRFLLYALQVVTRDQRAFNGALLDAVAELTRAVEGRLASIETRLDALERKLEVGERANLHGPGGSPGPAARGGGAEGA